jgi:hypothetical protein
MRNEFPGLPVAVGSGGAGKLASSGSSENGQALKSLRKIGFGFHYFLSRFFAGGT